MPMGGMKPPLDDEDVDEAVELDDELEVADEFEELELLDIPPMPPVCPAPPVPASPPSPPPPVRLGSPTAQPCKVVKATGKLKVNIRAGRAKWAKRREPVVRGFIDVFPCKRDGEHAVPSVSKRLIDDYGSY